MSFFESMGFIAYPLTIVGVLLVVEVARAIRAVSVSSPQTAALTSARIHPVLVWGVLAAVVGMIGTVVGIAVAADFLEAYDGPINPNLVWGGIKVALGSTIVGMLFLGFASIAWLALQFVNGRRAASA
jgi:uncharacterized membrane protein